MSDRDPRRGSAAGAPAAPGALPEAACRARRAFGKVLIANRGEIAVRLIRACREAGLTAVAVFSEADRDALHVRLAHEAYAIGPAPPGQSYLAIDTLLDVARRSRAAAAPGVPLVPGTREPLGSDAEAARVARELGYPVMIKAALGGGGKGMRLVADPAELATALRLARSEAASAFGDSSLYVEKAVAAPRHIEVQVLADRHGHVVHLGERECSIQRRHQKLIEEAPSPFVDGALRAAMGEAAGRLVASVGYENAGTVEFLVDADRKFYFLEVNARLQVEHPVTEWVTGIDLVQEQLRLAAGEPLGYEQADVTVRGWAIECRISAEDPGAGFLPSAGRVAAWRAPGGPWTRVDAGVYDGVTVPLHYDPLMAKLVVWGRDRAEAICRMASALDEFAVAGVRTTIPFHQAVMRHPDFRAGRLSTGFIAQAFPQGITPPVPIPPRIVALAAALHAHRRLVTRESGPAAAGPSAWALAARPVRRFPDR